MKSKWRMLAWLCSLMLVCSCKSTGITYPESPISPLSPLTGPARMPEMINFFSNRDGYTRYYAMSPDGTHVQPFIFDGFPSDALVGRPSWSSEMHLFQQFFLDLNSFCQSLQAVTASLPGPVPQLCLL